VERPSTHRVLETVFGRGAVEAWLLNGRPPLVRFVDTVREIETVPTLTPDMITAMVFEDLAPNLSEWFRDHGYCAFDYPCSWRDGARVRVFVKRHGDSTFVTLTPLAPDTPELKYSDEKAGGTATG
jgi:Tfp pilus assembly pilus retraction ATPase PilT